MHIHPVLVIWALYVLVSIPLVLFRTDTPPELVSLKEGQNVSRVTYIVPGFMPANEAKFRELASTFPGDVKLVNYTGRVWHNPRKLAVEIAIDAREYRDVRVLTLSLGDKVAEHVKELTREAKIYHLNPCTDSSFLKGKWGYRIAFWPAAVICAGLGGASFYPFIPIEKDDVNDGWRYSLAEIVTEGWALGYTQGNLALDEGVIISENDALLNNDAICEALAAAGVQDNDPRFILLGDAEHSNIVKDKDKILDALNRLGFFR